MSSEYGIFDGAYRGPRLGHWPVASSVGSFVDDRSPTIHSRRGRPRSTRSGVQSDEGLTKKLIRAAMEQKLTAASAAAKSTLATSVSSERTKASTTRSEAKAPEPFIVPPMSSRSYKSTKPDVAARTMELPVISAAGSVKSHQKPSSKPSVPPSVPRTSPPAATRFNAASVKLTKSLTRDGSIRTPQEDGAVCLPNLLASLPNLPLSLPKWTPASTIRVIDENGEIQVLNIPAGDYSKPTSSVRSVEQTNPATTRSGDDFIIPSTSACLDEKHKQLREHGTSTASVAPSNVSRKSAQSAMMSGALPAPSQKSNSVPQSATRSCKDSGVAMGSASAPDSKVNSRRTVSSRAGSDEIPDSVVSFARKIASISLPSDKQRMSVPTAPAPQLFEEVGMGLTTGYPMWKEVSERSNRSTGEPSTGSQRSAEQSVRSNASFNAESACSRVSSSEQGSQRTISSNAPSKAESTRSQVSGSQKPPQRSGSSSSMRSKIDGAGFHVSGSQKRSQGTIRTSASSARPTSEHGRQPSVKSNPKTPTARSTGSSSSITHTFGGFNQDGFVQQAGTQFASHNPRPAHQETRFAGDGWVSPHPLSVADTQSAVSIPVDGSGQRGTITHDQWRALRDASPAIAGSVLGSPVPSAVGLEPLPLSARNHPPPTGYIGSYHLSKAQPSRPRPQRDMDVGFDDSQARGPRTLVLLEELETSLLQVQQAQRQYYLAQNSAHSRTQRPGSRSSASARSRALRQAPSVHDEDTQWDSQAQFDGATSSHAQGEGISSNSAMYNNLVYDQSLPYNRSASSSRPLQSGGYNVGLTASDLANFQSQLSSTVSRYSSQLSHVQQERAPPQPDYNVWNNGQSRMSARATSHHSAHAFPPNLSYPRERCQLTMPWDQTSSRAGAYSIVSEGARSQHESSARRSSRNSSSTHGSSRDSTSRVADSSQYAGSGRRSSHHSAGSQRPSRNQSSRHAGNGVRVQSRGRESRGQNVWTPAQWEDQDVGSQRW
jgi:hypothetical protein